VLHSAAHAALGLDDWTYTRHEVQADQLAAVMASLGPEWAGLSLTMPLKQVVLPLLEEVSPLARDVGAVNTALPLGAPGGGPVRWRGENTDVHGVVSALWEAGAERASSAAVLGGGATATSTLAALRELGVREPVVLVRSPLRAAALQEVAARLGVEAHVEAWERARGVLDADVVVSTVPSGAADEVAAMITRPGSPRPRGVLLDVVYSPWPTELARAWASRGGTVVGGFTMLLHQAGEQVRLMTGSPPPLEAMREAGEAALAARGT
jgi:shikimate dehydrogenase